MKKIIDYTLIDGGDMRTIVSLAREMIKDGYQPFGPPATSWVVNKSTSGEGFTRYTQGMVKYED